MTTRIPRRPLVSPPRSPKRIAASPLLRSPGADPTEASRVERAMPLLGSGSVRTYRSAAAVIEAYASRLELPKAMALLDRLVQVDRRGDCLRRVLELLPEHEPRIARRIHAYLLLPSSAGVVCPQAEQILIDWLLRAIEHETAFDHKTARGKTAIDHKTARGQEAARGKGVDADRLGMLESLIHSAVLGERRPEVVTPCLALHATHSPSARFLLEIIGNDRAPLLLRHAAVTALAQSPDDRAGATLGRLLVDGRPPCLRREAALALGARVRLGGSQALNELSLLEDLARTGEGPIRVHAVRGLGRCLGRDALGLRVLRTLLSACRSSLGTVRREALLALDRGRLPVEVLEAAQAGESSAANRQLLEELRQRRQRQIEARALAFERPSRPGSSRSPADS